MEIHYDQKLGMLEETNAYLDDHIAVWTAVPIISNYKNKVHELVYHIKEVQKKTDPANIHKGQSILHLKKQIADKMDILDDTLEAYAEDIGDNELRKLADNYYSDYFRLPYEAFEEKVTDMITLLEKHVDKMHDYGLVQDQIDDVKLNLDEYQLSLDKPRSYKIGQAIAQESIEEHINEASEYADKLDRVMKRFKRSHVTFYNGYLAARTVEGS